MALLNACVLVKTVPTRLTRIAEAVRGLAGVRKVYAVYGRFDVVVFVEGSDYPAIREISTQINRMEGVRSTETLLEA